MVGSPVGGFFPIPLAMMIPFMATQSLIMGDAFGRSFQYGKRKISAMTNDEFNELTTEKIAETIYSEYKNIIPKLNQSLVDSQQLQNKVIDELLALPSNFLAQIFDKIANPDKISNDFIPNSNNPADSRTWAPGWSPSPSQDFNPPAGAPQPSPTPAPTPPPSGAPGAQSPHTPTPTPEKTYTISYQDNISGPLVQHKLTEAQYADILASWRIHLTRQKTEALQKYFLKLITSLSTSLHTLTGRWH